MTEIDTTTTTWTDAETGHTMVRCEINPNLLHELSVDTYTLFQVGGGDYEAREIEHLEEYSDVELLGYDDFNWVYNNKLWLKYLSETMNQYVVEEQPWGSGVTKIVHKIEFGETISPREYNFTTDKNFSVWTVDETALREWWAKSKFTFEAEMADGGRHGSHSGYASFIESRHREEPLEVELGMMLDRWIESWSVWDKFVSYMREGMTGNGQDQDCVEMIPNTNAGLLAWVQADRDVDDNWVNDFAAREISAADIRVGDRLVMSYLSRAVTQVRRTERIDRSMWTTVDARYPDGSGGQLQYSPGQTVFRAFDPARDGNNER